MSVHVAFDIYPAATPNGSLLVRLLASDQAVELTCRKVLHGSGMGQIRIHSDHAAATSANFTKHNYVKVVLVNGATETEWFGFFMEEGDFGAVSRREQGSRMLTFSGPGSLYYLDRALLLSEIYAPGQPRRGNLELDGTWGWNDVPYGAIMTRAIEEGQNQPGTPLADATMDFDRLVDSAAVAWPNIDNEYTTPWGTSVYDVIANFIRLGLTVTVDPDLTFHAWQTYGTNRTSATFAAGKIRFEQGVNIGNEVTRQIRAALERSHMFVTGDEFTSAVVSGGSSAVTYYDTLDRRDTNDPATLTVAGQHNLDAREIQADAAFPVRVVIDDDELAGLYVPGEHYDVGDIATIHTVPPGEAANDHDYDDFAIEVAAIKLEHDDAGNWFAVNELGAQYLAAQRSAFEERSSRVVHQIELCRPMTASAASCALPDSDMTQIATPNGDLETGTGANWFGNPTPTAGGPPGSSWHLTDIGVGAGGWIYEGLHALTFTAGQTYIARIWVRDGHQFQFGHIASADFAEWNGNGDSAGERLCLEWTPTANRTGVEVIYRRVVTGTVALDEVTVYTGGTSGGDAHADLIGTSIRAKRCDDTEHYFSTAEPTVNDDTLSGFRNGTHWVQVDDADDPTESFGSWMLFDNSGGAAVWIQISSGTAGPDLTGINFLVGTASGDLSAEIVVGTTPGGELGGTWASPTVDATHSGSAHHAENHAGRHEDGGADELEVEDLATAETDTDLVLRPDGGGGVQWAADSGSPGGGGGATIIVREVGGADIEDVAELEFDASDFVVTEPSAGIARVELTSPGGGGDAFTQVVDEDGSDFTNWTAVLGTWSSDGTVIKQTNTGAASMVAYYELPFSQAGALFEGEVMFPNSGDQFGGFALSDSSGNTGGMHWRLSKVDQQIQAAIYGSANTEVWAATITEDVWHKLRAHAVGQRLALWFDGTYVDTTILPISTINRVTLILFTFSAEAHFRNIKVWTPTLPA